MVKRYGLKTVTSMSGLDPYESVEECEDGWYVLHADYEALEARVAELENDAARYRWLRENCVEQAEDDDVGPYLYHGVPWNCNWRRDIDDAVDEAMSREA